MGFEGFGPGLLDFLRGLREHNSREWFQAHYGEYQRFLVEPAREFVAAIGNDLTRLGEDVHAEPRVGGSILRINRDTRFAKDKTPYKSHLDLWFWQGHGASRERPGYFIRLAPERLTLGAGMHVLPDRALLRKDGLTQALTAIPGEYEVHRERGLYAQTSMPLPEQTFTSEFPAFCFGHFQHTAPLQQWLVQALAS